MANYNRCIFVGRITREPESRTFANGGKVTKFGFAASAGRKKNASGQWEDEPMFIDCEVFNRGDYGKLADLVADKCRKGSQVLIEGKLHLETWEDKNGGGKRSKHKIIVDLVQLLDCKPSDDNSHREPHQKYGLPVKYVENQPGSAAGGDSDIPF